MSFARTFATGVLATPKLVVAVSGLAIINGAETVIVTVPLTQVVGLAVAHILYINV